MLSVGREIGISDKSILCRNCSWEGTGAELSCGLMRVVGEPYLLYAYRCPGCLSFNIIRKGKLLKSRSLNSHCDKNSFDEL